jgi:glucose/arabinose dehydrogenase
VAVAHFPRIFPKQPARPRAKAALTRAVLAAALLLSTAGLSLAARPAAAAPPADFQTSLVVGDGLDGPSGMEIAPDGRIFILERAGTIKIVKDGQLLPQPFAVLPSEASGDRGLIGIAFDPDFGVENHYVYFYYTGHDLLNHLVRFNADTDVGTEGPFQLFQTQSPSQLLHVGGSIRFGPDGKLYFAVGDNGRPQNAQELDNPHGKILRINKDGTIPSDNPFYDQPGKLGAIWAYGFRNPWRFQFDSATGQLYAGDVGDFTWEELDRVVKGGNYGWPLKEGMCTADCAGFIDPIYTYNHNNESAAITAGPIYRSSMFPAQYQGSLFFGDYAKGFIKRAILDSNGNVSSVVDFDPVAGAVTDLKVAQDGSLYYINYWPGALYHVTYNTQHHAPVAAAAASVTKGVAPLAVNFSSAGSNDPDGDQLSYLWAFGDGTTSGDPNPTKTYSATGVYTARLTVSANGDQTVAQPIVIQVGIAPNLIVATPTEGQLYRAGDTITYNAFASDGAGFDLNDAGISTVVRLHHGTHYHPFAGPLIGRAGSFTIPVIGEASADTSYELTVTATDANGLSTTKVVTIRPRTSHLTVTTSPPGIPLTVDGVPISTPQTFTGVVGFRRDLAAPVSATASDGTPLQFAGWSDGRQITHTIVTPDADTTYTAMYVPSAPFVGQYFDNTTFSGSPVLTRQDPSVDFNWGEGSPDPVVPANNFAVRWTKTQAFGAGRYRFTVTADDGVRFYLDNRLIVDHWPASPGTPYTYDADLGTGNHSLKVEYYEAGGGAAINVAWARAAVQPSDTFHAEYWNTPNSALPSIPSTPPVFTAEEFGINHQWGSGSPGPGIGVDRFVARWTRTLNLAPGDYQFSATADDGVRLYLDGTRVIDKWIDQGPTTYSVSLPMDGGPHSLVMEYYESGGDATAKLTITQLDDIGDPPEWHGEYWNDTTWPPVIPARPPDLERTDPSIGFDWFSGSPAPSITSDRFVARWTRSQSLSAGAYRFSGTADDGIRVFLDDVPVVDLWQPQHTDYSVQKNVAAGVHTIRVEYFEFGGDATARFDFERIGDAAPDTPPFIGEYFANRNLSGSPVVTRQDNAVNFDWGQGSPDPAVPADNFSARWSQTENLAAGNYAFTATTDDGVRLLIDGHVLIDKWIFQGPTTYTTAVNLPAGQHTIVVEYFEAGGGAQAHFHYQPTSDPAPPLPPDGPPITGEYFNNTTLDGAPALTRVEAKVDYDWGEGSPDPAIAVNNFSARWTQTPDLAPGNYQFSVTADDGVRLFLDGHLVIDKWIFQGPTTYTTAFNLPAGQHTIVMEYFESGGGAVARLSYQPTSDPAPPLPTGGAPITAEYFTNASLSGPPAITRVEAKIDNNWGAGSPHPANSGRQLLGPMDADDGVLRRHLSPVGHRRRRHPCLRRRPVRHRRLVGPWTDDIHR